MMKSANETSRHHTGPGGVRYPLTDKASLSAIRRSMRAEFSRAGIDGAVTFDCLVAVTEACSNALIHGCGANEEPHSVVSWQVDPTCLSFCIQDFGGREWSKTAHPSRAQPKESSAAEDRIGGYGLGLMRGLMDQVEIGYRSGGTRVTMVKDLPVRRPVTS